MPVRGRRRNSGSRAWRIAGIRVSGIDAPLFKFLRIRTACRGQAFVQLESPKFRARSLAPCSVDRTRIVAVLGQFGLNLKGDRGK